MAALVLTLTGLVFLGSATQDDPQQQGQHGKQALLAACSFGVGFFVLLPHYARVLRGAWVVYGVVVLALAGLPFFAPEINGARRWYMLPGFSIQPSEFAKLAVVIALAAWLRFKSRADTFEALIVPLLLTAVPALLILRQPDLGSSLVFWPVLVAMCWCAGASTRSVFWLIVAGLLVAAIGGLFFLHGYQQQRLDVWWSQWHWDELALAQDPVVRDLVRGPGYQPWQALIALGGGGLLGFGVGQGPQNRYDFLPYRTEDYMFAVVGEETGWLGCLGVLLLHAAIVLGMLHVATRTRERFGRLLCVGIATWQGGQVLLHAAVCAWLLPATGLPMPLLSYGGSSLLATVLGIALCCNVGARRERVLAGDGFR